MTTTRPLSRLVGLLYVLISLPGFYGLAYVPSRLIVRGDAAATAHRILAAPAFFRSGIVADLLGQALFVLVALALYRLLRGAGRLTALLMLILLVVQVPIASLAEVNHLNVLAILTGPGASAFGEAQRNAQAMAALGAYDNAISVDEIFMGLWLLPLALLVWRCGFLPRFLAVTLVLAAAGYLAECLTYMLAPAYGHAVSGSVGQLRTLELVTPLWLLIVGAKDRPLAA